MSTPHSVRFEAFKVTKTSKRKPTGEEVVINDLTALITGLDALGLDGYQLVVCNDRKDLPPEGGFWEAELGASVVPQLAEKLLGVEADQLVAAVPSAPASLKENFLALQRFYSDAAEAGVGLNLYPLSD